MARQGSIDIILLFSILFVFFALLIQKDRGNGPFDVLASYPPLTLEGVVLNPITAVIGT